MKKSLAGRLLLVACTIAITGAGVGSSQADSRTSAEPGEGMASTIGRDETSLGLRRVDTVEPLDQASLDRVLELRRWIGLNDDPIFVRNLYDDPSPGGVFVSEKTLVGGLRFAGSEADDVLAISQLEYAGYVIADFAESSLGGAVFSGAEVKQRVLRVYCKGCIQSDLRREIVALGRIIGDGNRLELVDVSFSLLELRKSEHEIAEYLARSGAKYAGTGVDYAANAVLVVGPHALEAKVLEAFPGLSIVFEIEDSVPVDEVTKWDPLGYGVVEGGQGIMREDVPYQWAACTSGFAVNSPAYGPFMLTAGHCSSLGGGCTTGQKWIQGGAILGTMSACMFQGSFDVGMISTAGWRNNIGRIHDSDVDYFHAVTFPVTTQNLSGVTVCQHGVTTAVPAPACGTVLQLDFRPSGTGDDGLIWNSDFVRASYQSDGGDSGSGITWSTLYGYGATGIHKSSVPSGAYFTKYSKIATLWGLTLTPP
ncbi:MAG: hypothetical protein AAB131_07665 [Actinomycetota bacterium]